ncbi:MAG TPA: Xaa-Pro peptidase family protein [Candidatus Eisenbacteria bacterium]|jgi:Xaa-Pro aminopeptidase
MPSAPTPTQAPSLAALKLAQARSFLHPSGLDAWLLAVRESSERPDPTLRYFTDQDFTWNSYFLITPSRTWALVATFDAPDLQGAGIFDEVRTYKEGPKEALLALLRERDPKRIGINVSPHDALADGLTAGLRDALEDSLAGTPYAERLVTAETLVAKLRSVKLPEEQACIRRTVDETEEIFASVAREIRVGMSAREVAARFHARADHAGLRTAWPRRHCPTVTVGAAAPVGHVSPGGERIARGCVVHVDFGVIRDGYCSDLQRVWYVAPTGGREAPPPVQAAYGAVVEAIEAGARALRPGKEGWTVDEAARSTLRARGYPEYAHALGHHLGRTVHDGGGVLGPRWERYGDEPFRTVELGHVYTLEPSIHLPEHGLLSLEEDVVVTGRGTEFLSRFPRALPILLLE